MSILNISGSWICLWFWIWQGFEQAIVLNMPRFWICFCFSICPGSECIRVKQFSEYAWICLTMSGWICLYMSELAGIWVNIPKSSWMVFVLYLPIVIPCLLENVVTYFNIYTKLDVLVWMKIKLFFWRHTVWFSSCNYFIFLFCFWLNVSTSKISKLQVPLEIEGYGSVNLDISYFSLLLLVAFVLKHNVKKNMLNIDVRIHVKLELQEIGC